MPMQSRFERDVQKVVGTKMDLDPDSIAGRLDIVENEVAGKANVNHTHSIVQVNGLSQALNDKADVSIVSGLADALDDLEADVDAHGSDLDALTTSVGNHGQRIAALETGEGGHEQRITDLETSVGDLSGEVSDLEDALNTLSSNVDNKADIVGDALQLPSASSTSMPSATPAGRLVYVSDLETLGVSTGTSWINIQTGDVI